MTVTLCICFMGISVVFFAAFQSPGVNVLQESTYPMIYSFANYYQIPLDKACIFLLPMLASSFIVAMYYLVAIVKAVAASGLLPAFLLQTQGSEKIPYRAIRATYWATFILTIIQVGLTVISVYVSLILYTLEVLFLYTIWVGIFIAYLVFRLKYQNTPRQFRNPLGTYGAYIGIFSSIQHSLSLFYPFHSYGIYSIIFYFLFMIVCTYIYVHYVNFTQRYSPEEEGEFFVTYVVNGKLYIHIY
jgi:amino acid transporter